MTFRYARHTSNLKALEKFYTELVGLKKLGGFENHSSYNGIFLGDPAENWHLEFTTSNENPIHQFDEEDALVFYLENEMEFT
ncbi:MAG: VOC family protein, partial [Fluviicola sp.]